VTEVDLSASLTYWTAPHPQWNGSRGWPEEVGFVTWLGPTAFVLIDPLVRDDLDASAWEAFDRRIGAAGRPVVVLLTAPWHLRSTRAVAERYGSRVWLDPQGHARAQGLPAADGPPPGIATYRPGGMDEGQIAFSITSERSLIVGEFLGGTTNGLEIRPSPAMRNMSEFVASLRLLRAMAIERVLVSHGPPVLSGGAEAIAAAIAAFTPILT
jgi:glyoxylase-like metal-dependent hydrolase (beta-lactamase superfamily II)